MSGEMLKKSHTTKNFTSQIDKIKLHIGEEGGGTQKRHISQM